MHANPRIEVVGWVLRGAVFVLAVVLWPSAPERIPVHRGIAGEPDRYGGKTEGLLLLPLITLGVYLLMLFLPRIHPRRAAYAQFEGTYGMLRSSIVAFLALLYGFVLLWIEERAGGYDSLHRSGHISSESMVGRLRGIRYGLHHPSVG